MTKPPMWKESQQLPRWVEKETTKTRKPPTPKDMPRRQPAKPEIPSIPRLHVRVELAGSIEFVLEGDDSVELRGLLNSNPSADDVIEHLDPWSSGAAVRQRVTILQDPGTPSGPMYYFAWSADEAAGGVHSNMHTTTGSPFYYKLTDDKPYFVDWNRSPYPVLVPWEPKK